MRTIHSKTILFVTGLFVSNSCWDEWKAYYQSKGYDCYAPAHPHKDAPAQVLRNRQPDAEIASLRLAELTDYFANFAEQLPERPILIGHSIGGLITQILLQRDLAAAGVAIHSVPPQEVFTFKPSFYRATWGPLGLLTSAKKSFLMSFKQWQYAFTNGMSLAEQRASYEKYCIPESKRISRDGLTRAAKVNFSKLHVPLLFVSGSMDHIMPASLNFSNYKKYKNRDSVTDYKEFPGRNHFVLGQPTWKEDADYILNWIDAHQPVENENDQDFLTFCRTPHEVTA